LFLDGFLRFWQELETPATLEFIFGHGESVGLLRQDEERSLWQDFEPYLGSPINNHSELSGGFPGKIDYSTPLPRATVIDAHLDRTPIRPIRDPEPRAKRKRPVGSSKPGRIVGLTA
jgi:hypothetical protein